MTILEQFDASLLPYATGEELRELRQILARQTPAGFAMEASAGRWVMPPHLALLNEKLVDAAAGRVKRLIISMPPRHGKSMLVSQYFPAWFLGRFPDKRVILTSYEADFAEQWGRKVRDALESAGPRLFGITVRRDSSAASRWDIAGRLGGMQTAGVGGPLTGKGADLLVVDDPLKNSEEANSATIREKHKDWWRSTAYTRIEPSGTAIVMATRWHEDDLSGWLISESKAGSEPWEVLNLPALAEENDPLGRQPGEALWPERYNAAHLEQTRRTVGSYWFSAMFQGSPQPAEGNKFKRPWFRYWKADDDLYRLMDAAGNVLRSVRARDCRRFGTVDLAVSLKTSADYTVIAAWAVSPESDLILLDLLHERMEEPDIIKQARGMYERHGLDYLAVEANGTQLGIVQTMRRVESMAIRGIVNSTDKVSRASTAIVRCEAGQIYFPQAASWLGAYENELLSFPKGAHDDQVDVTSLAANDVFAYGGAPEPEEAREARERAEAAKREAEWRSPDNPAWWDEGGRW